MIKEYTRSLNPYKLYRKFGAYWIFFSAYIAYASIEIGIYFLNLMIECTGSLNPYNYIITGEYRI